MSTVLVVDDEPIVREVVVRYLHVAGYRTLEAGDGDLARTLIERERPNLVVLDLMLPGTDGLSLCRWIRSSSDVPILMLTARGEEVDRIVGLEVGADDYLSKPFSMRELVARIRAMLRRRELLIEEIALAGAPNEAVLTGAGDLAIDVSGHHVTRRGEPLMLTPKEFALLETLVRHRGQVLS